MERHGAIDTSMTKTPDHAECSGVTDVSAPQKTTSMTRKLVNGSVKEDTHNLLENPVWTSSTRGTWKIADMENSPTDSISTMIARNVLPSTGEGVSQSPRTSSLTWLCAKICVNPHQESLLKPVFNRLIRTMKIPALPRNLNSTITSIHPRGFAKCSGLETARERMRTSSALLNLASGFVRESGKRGSQLSAPTNLIRDTQSLAVTHSGLRSGILINRLETVPRSGGMDVLPPLRISSQTRNLAHRTANILDLRSRRNLHQKIPSLDASSLWRSETVKKPTLPFTMTELLDLADHSPTPDVVGTPTDS